MDLQFLGTSSGVPTKARNVSATAVIEASGTGWYLVDCGEGTQHQLLHSPLSVRDLRAITGQQPMITRARKSIATFRLRAGMPIGCKVTLRGDRMWEFFDRLTSVAIPRIRDFRGISAKSFDGRGNFSMGVTEQLIFPEIDFDSVDHQRGMDITFVTTANTDEEAKALLDAFGFPFKK